jgi:hypothetical protein
MLHESQQKSESVDKQIRFWLDWSKELLDWSVESMKCIGETIAKKSMIEGWIRLWFDLNSLWIQKIRWIWLDYCLPSNNSRGHLMTFFTDSLFSLSNLNTILSDPLWNSFHFEIHQMSGPYSGENGSDFWPTCSFHSRIFIEFSQRGSVYLLKSTRWPRLLFEARQ